MDTRVVALGVGVACLVALWGVAGSVQAPRTPAGVEYDVVAPSPTLEFPDNTGSGSGGDSESGLLDRTSTEGSLVGPIGLVAVLGLWVLVAFWLMGLTTTLLFVLVTTLFFGLYLVSSFGVMNGTAGTVVQSVPSVVDGVVLVLYLLLQLCAVAYVLLPDDSVVRTEAASILATLRSRYWSLTGNVGHLRSRFSTSNDVYDAWLTVARMADRDVNSHTPREIADAAIDTGLPGEDVEELRRLYEATRYGTRDPDADQRRHAQRIVERIEESR